MVIVDKCHLTLMSSQILETICLRPYEERGVCKLKNIPKEHPCDPCVKTFTSPSHLECHKLSHSGEKSHFCTLCDISFSNTGKKPLLSVKCVTIRVLNQLTLEFT